MENSSNQGNQDTQSSKVENNLLTGHIENHLYAAARIVNSVPVEYRLARKPSGELILQGACQWWEGTISGIEWKEIPIVDL